MNNKNNTGQRLKLHNKELILFDLDGTLIDSVPDLTLAVNEMLSALNRKTFPEDTVRYWVGNGAQMLVKRALLGTRETDEEVDEVLFEKAMALFLDFYAKHLAESTVTYPHVEETLRSLKNNGYRLAVITNKPFAFVGPILKNLGLDDLFELIQGGDSLPQKKPNPAPLLHTCRTLGLSVETSLMVGDSKNDIIAAKAAGMQSIGVTYGYNYGEDIAVHGPNVIVDDFADIIKHLI
ncbi:phosphoglycolate phosphatase [Sulfurovum lithotrophicum]|uniref:phosphoglycolate phosphatase n=1 Tax=Sulfurovum lithotrophicum TaxID=206403 RepID=UPI000A7277DE|nr:phosphoglycolate phosphatase [Sulfurovum lithotrophicum]